MRAQRGTHVFEFNIMLKTTDLCAATLMQQVHLRNYDANQAVTLTLLHILCIRTKAEGSRTFAEGAARSSYESTQ